MHGPSQGAVCTSPEGLHIYILPLQSPVHVQHKLLDAFLFILVCGGPYSTSKRDTGAACSPSKRDVHSLSKGAEYIPSRGVV